MKSQAVLTFAELEPRLLLSAADWATQLATMPSISSPAVTAGLIPLNTLKAQSRPAETQMFFGASRKSDDYGNTLTAAAAAQLGADGAAAIAGRIGYGGDVDVLSLTATVSGSMRIALQPSEVNTLSPNIRLYNSSGGLLAFSVNSDGVAVLTMNVAAGVQYYVALSGLNMTTGMYAADVTTAVQPPPTPPQPDPTPEPPPPPTPPAPEPSPEPAVSPVVPSPGAAVAAYTQSIGSALWLMVMGTASVDAITISQTATALVVTSAAGTMTYTGLFAGIEVYGFAGNDFIRFDSTVTAVGRAFGGDGNDQLFDAGAGASALSGEAGDDLLVALGDGIDSLTGGAGTDSFWADTVDAIADATAQETAAGAVHRVAAFFQPYTTDPAGANYIPMQIAGQNFADPALTSAASGYQNFAATLPLFADGAQYDDIRQGSGGDCYFLSSLASIAGQDVGIINQMIAPLGDGTFVVRFYRNGQPVYVRMDADLPVNASGSLVYAKSGPDGELWVPLVEKAYAYFRTTTISYASIYGGVMSNAYKDLTGAAYSWYNNPGSINTFFDYAATALAAGNPVTAGSKSAVASPIYAGHAYMVQSVETTAAGRFVTLYDPFGSDITLTAEQFCQYFSCIVAAKV